MKYFISTSLILLSLLFSCSNDNNNNEADYRCCTDEINGNINNLNQSTNISIYNVITPNGDGVNDLFFIENIELFPNNRVTISDLKNETVFDAEGYGLEGTFFGGADLQEGSYIYKIVIENEETFLLQGYLCIVKNLDNNFKGGLGCRTLFGDPIL